MIVISSIPSMSLHVLVSLVVLQIILICLAILLLLDLLYLQMVVLVRYVQTLTTSVVHQNLTPLHVTELLVSVQIPLIVDVNHALMNVIFAKLLKLNAI